MGVITGVIQKTIAPVILFGAMKVLMFFLQTNDYLVKEIVYFANKATGLLVACWLVFIFFSYLNKHVSTSKYHNVLGPLFIFIKIPIIIFIAMELLQALGLNITRLFAIGGFGGVIIGMGSKEIVQSFLSTILINVEGNVRVGDTISAHIIVGSKEFTVKGLVQKIRWRDTLIIQENNIPISVPNDQFANANIENKSLVKSYFFDKILVFKKNKDEKIDATIHKICALLKQIDDAILSIDVTISKTDAEHYFLQVKALVNKNNQSKYGNESCLPCRSIIENKILLSLMSNFDCEYQ